MRILSPNIEIQKVEYSYSIGPCGLLNSAQWLMYRAEDAEKGEIR